MPNPNRVLDKSFLSADHADDRVVRHRDLISHAFRWAHVARYLQNKFKDSMVLDVGCGKEMPLAKMLYSNRLIVPLYVGVDANNFEIPEMLVGKKLNFRVWAGTDFCALDQMDVSLEGNETLDGKYTLPNVLTCFEVLEHVTPEHCRRMLRKFQELTSDDCHYFISTPCWDVVNCAENHINEMKVEALGAVFEELGYHIEGFWGTFASQKDYKPLMEVDYPGITKIYSKLHEFYDSTVLSVMFAPLFPYHSRNAMWHLTRKKGDAKAQTRLFPPLETVPTPWTSSKSWKDLAGKEAA